MSVHGHIASEAGTLSYAISATLVLNDVLASFSNVLAFFDHHTWVFGAILGVITYITNFVFQCLNRKALLANQKRKR